MPKPKSRLWLVTLTEQYQVKVWATTRNQALKAIVEFGGGGPVRSLVTARPIAGKEADAVFEEAPDA